MILIQYAQPRSKLLTSFPSFRLFIMPHNCVPKGIYHYPVLKPEQKRCSAKTLCGPTCENGVSRFKYSYDYTVCIMIQI
jgi:hypothetical protein